MGPCCFQSRALPGSIAGVEFGARLEIGGASGFLGAVRIVFGWSGLHSSIADWTMQPLRQSRCRNNDETESGQRNLRIERVHFKTRRRPRQIATLILAPHNDTIGHASITFYLVGSMPYINFP